MKFLTLSFLFLSISYAAPKENAPSKLNQYFALIEAKNKGMGAILMSENGLESYAHAYGYANI